MLLGGSYFIFHLKMPLPNEIETDIKMDDELARANLTVKKALWNRSNVL